MSADPLVFIADTSRGRARLFWVESGTLWTWSRTRWRWWPVFNPEPMQVRGTVLNRDQVLEVVMERGRPNRPRVDAGGWLPCLACGSPAGEGRLWVGNRGPFCCETHRQRWLDVQPVIDWRSTR